MKLTYRKYTVTRVENCTHDTKHVVLEPVYSTHLVVPPGKHIHIRGEREELELVRSYTPVIPLNSGTDSEDSELHFLIKIYMDGAFTPLIDDLKIGDELELSDYTGDFNINKLKEFSQIYLIAAGTGITPIARILPLLSGVKTTLIYFNKTIKDVIWGKELSLFSESNSWFKIHNVFSQQSEESQLSGRISKQVLEKFIYSGRENAFSCVCGPIPFNQEAERLLSQDFGFSSSSIHIFQG
ncbi:cytochrome b5 reductase 4 [Eurytemora carolleeae]|uniref:cytochrome b5 reductase 4 n=1 Tax=Eurytemora carolleeae TaxID=1294199 RepID=UPI000C785D48|nr:cytochrome b5 reductase 4 [Eurytemora carolleeae]|eukprot:XP_023344203.1 cytochrome b5 reductase 4-like [Eurytemora affinis]